MTVCRLPGFGRLTFSKPVCGSAHDERACENTGGGCGCGGMEEVCVGLGRCGLDADGEGTFDIRLSSV